MSNEERKTMLKIDLGISTTVYDERLLQYIQTAELEIKREGYTFPETPTIDDDQLIVMYAAWLWRKRDSGEGMPRMLRYTLNNRIFSQKMKTEGDSNR